LEVPIEYVTTPDGVNISYWAVGEGETFLHMPNPPWSHGTVARQIPEMRRWFLRLAAKRSVVRYDNRGSGLSDRGISDFSVEGMARDLEAVVGRLGLRRFALFAYFSSGPMAIHFAATHPELVSHLILWCSYADRADYARSPKVQATRALMDADWDTYTETAAHVLLGWSEGEEAHRLAGYMQEAVDPETAREMFRQMDAHDVTRLLPALRCPTLVLHRRQVPWADESVPRRLAAAIPGARLVLLEGASPVPGLGDMEAVLRAIGDFIGEDFGEPTAPGAGLVTILFTDMEGSTTVTQRLGDAKAQDLLRAHNTIIRDALKAHGGSEIKHTGDGIMASFPSASGGLECAIAIQRAFEGATPEPIRVRIGLNAGEPVAEDGDIFGAAVQLAARVCARAEAGQVLVSNVVRELAMGKGFLFSDVGDVVLKGFEDPVRLYEVRSAIETS